LGGRRRIKKQALQRALGSIESLKLLNKGVEVNAVENVDIGQM
jgi:hypothetical protein